MYDFLMESESEDESDDDADMAVFGAALHAVV